MLPALRLTSATNPENSTVSYTYDADGTLASKTDAKSNAETYTYDTYGRLTGIPAGNAKRSAAEHYGWCRFHRAYWASGFLNKYPFATAITVSTRNGTITGNVILTAGPTNIANWPPPLVDPWPVLVHEDIHYSLQKDDISIALSLGYPPDSIADASQFFSSRLQSNCGDQ